MLKLTKKTDYGLISLRHIAVSPRGTASAKEISDAYGIPLPLLAKVLQALTKGHLAQSVAGTNGGYRLARDPQSITALEVIQCIDGPAILTNCFTEHGACGQSDRCTVREPLRHVQEAILNLLSKMTIADLARDGSQNRKTESPPAALASPPQAGYKPLQSLHVL
jgi:FeS assembly SUF system regulator